MGYNSNHQYPVHSVPIKGPGITGVSSSVSADGDVFQYPVDLTYCDEA